MLSGHPDVAIAASHGSDGGDELMLDPVIFLIVFLILISTTPKWPDLWP